jgi:PhoPQ-activated pathogenicity-related protein
MKSQTWQGLEWKHWLTVIKPETVTHPDKSLLLITGGNNGSESPDLKSDEARIVNQLATATGTVVAMLEQVPNQPLFDGKEEDGIIALTFDKFLNGEGDDWPLLLPMVKSAVRAMDTIQAVGKQDMSVSIDGFVVLGGSKRGWTTWLSAVADKRVVGIAPAVIDMLNMVPQAKNQLASYGTFSDEIADYTQNNIQARMNSPEGERLRAVVDPFSYRDLLTLPKLIVLGTNDPYWNVDSSSTYFPDLKGDKYLYYCANTGHDVNLGGVAAITAFYESIVHGTKLPETTWQRNAEGALEVKWSDPSGHARLWKATAPSRDFRKAEWSSEDLPGQGSATVNLPAPEQGWLAYYVEVVFNKPNGGTAGQCTTMTVLPDTYPFPDAVAKLGVASTDGKS